MVSEVPMALEEVAPSSGQPGRRDLRISGEVQRIP